MFKKQRKHSLQCKQGAIGSWRSTRGLPNQLRRRPLQEFLIICFRRSPRLAVIRAAANDATRVPDNLPPVRRSPRPAAKVASENPNSEISSRLKKQSPDSSKQRSSTKKLITG
ncbi:hypothetical protein SLE2022_396700 [Rubroshorea leprosula]